jgi:signal transduction histidine kinase
MSRRAAIRWAALRRSAAQHPGRTDALVAVALYLLATFTVTTSGELSRPDGELIGAAANLAIVLPLAWRRRAPLAVLCGVVLASGLSLALLGGSGGEAAVAVALATFAAEEPDQGRLVPAAIASAAFLLLAIIIDGPGGTVAVLTTVLAALAAAFCAGLAVRARRAQRDALADRSERLRRQREQETELAVARERERIAGEVHDIVAHNIAVMVALADGAAASVATSPAEAREAVDHIAGTGRDALAELKGLLDVLGHDGEPHGLRPQPGLDDLDDLLRSVRGAGLETRFRVEGRAVAVGAMTATTIYRIVQEALTNILRHARGATFAEVKLSFGTDELALEVLDDGRGSVADRAEGRGLRGMRDRAAVLGAAFQAGPVDDAGWRIAATIPLGDKGLSSA